MDEYRFFAGDLVGGSARFRDWGLMRYWFRGVCASMPWVRKIHFVTYGHVPDWLNTAHPKLRVVRHSDFMPPEALPTFNSCAIEMCLDRIPDLAENFIYFNDDMFVLAPLAESDFFEDGLPRDFAAFDIVRFAPDAIGELVAQNIKWVNAFFPAKEVYSRNFKKLVSARNGIKCAIKNFLAMKMFRGAIPNFYNPHLPAALMKRTFAEVREKCGEIVAETTACRLREDWNVSHWLVRNWQLAKGDYVPRRFLGKYWQADGANTDEICRCVATRGVPMVCINDSPQLCDSEPAAAKLRDAFEAVFPEKCEFERRSADRDAID